MIDLHDKLPDDLIIGNQYTKKDLDKLFNTSEIEKIYGGIGKIGNRLILLMTLDKEYPAETPIDRKKMKTDDINIYTYRHCDYFDIEQNIFCWDGPTDMNLDSPLIKDFTSKIYQCLLFIREYVHKDDYEFDNKIFNQNYFYCGKIKHQKYIDTDIIHFLSSLEDETDEMKLGHLYDYRPPNLEKRIKDFDVLKEKNKNDFIDLVESKLETINLERKSTFSGTEQALKEEMINKNLKAVAGFLNEKGGNLMIGQSDDGEITGVEKDCNFKNQDYFHIFILTKMREKITNFENIIKYLTIQFQSVPTKNNKNVKKLVCRINCRPLPKDLIAYVNGRAYQRVGPQTNELIGQELVSWENKRRTNKKAK